MVSVGTSMDTVVRCSSVMADIVEEMETFGDDSDTKTNEIISVRSQTPYKMGSQEELFRGDENVSPHLDSLPSELENNAVPVLQFDSEKDQGYVSCTTDSEKKDCNANISISVESSTPKVIVNKVDNLNENCPTVERETLLPVREDTKHDKPGVKFTASARGGESPVAPEPDVEPRRASPSRFRKYQRIMSSSTISSKRSRKTYSAVSDMSEISLSNYDRDSHKIFLRKLNLTLKRR